MEYSDTIRGIRLANKYVRLFPKAKLKISGYGLLAYLGSLDYQLRNYTPEFISNAECEGDYTYSPKDMFCVFDRKLATQGKLKPIFTDFSLKKYTSFFLSFQIMFTLSRRLR